MQKQVLYMQGWKQGTYKGHKQTTIRYCKPTEHASEGSVARVASDVSCRPDNNTLSSIPGIHVFSPFTLIPISKNRLTIHSPPRLRMNNSGKRIYKLYKNHINMISTEQMYILYLRNQSLVSRKLCNINLF